MNLKRFHRFLLKINVLLLKILQTLIIAGNDV